MSEYAFSVDLGGLEDLIARMAGFEQRAESLAADVESQVNRLHADWSGRAAEEHRAAHRHWRHGAGEMQAAATELRHVVATAHGNYAAAVAANARMWS